MKVAITSRESNFLWVHFGATEVKIDLRKESRPANEIERGMVEFLAGEEMMIVGMGKEEEYVWIPKKEKYHCCILVYPFENEFIATSSDSELKVIGPTSDEAAINLAKLMEKNDPVKLGEFDDTYLFFV